MPDMAAGQITLNTITPTFDEQGKWKGEYFTDYPITIRQRQMKDIVLQVGK